MKYDFTTALVRRGHDSAAEDMVGSGAPNAATAPKEGFDYIPMAVADMGFKTCPAIVERIKERLEHPIFGYYRPRQEFFDGILNWQKDRYGVELTQDCIGYEHGVHGGNVTALRVLARQGDRILIHTPIYASFLRNLKDLGYNAVCSPLIQDENGVYRMNFEDMEEKIIANKIHVLLFCSPYNPLGRVWERWELEKMMELCKKHDVYVISDEIWADFAFSGHKHIPLPSISEDAKYRTIAMYAPSKTFNLAGLVGSYHVIHNKYLRDRFEREAALTHYNKMNLFSMYAFIGAYSAEGREWVDELVQVIEGNSKYATKYIREHFEGVSVPEAQGTYVIFLDCTEWCKKHGKTLDELIHAGWDVGVGWQDGRGFGGECHIRMNLAQPSHRVEQAFDRLTKYVFNAEW